MTHLDSILIAMDAIFSGKSLREKDHITCDFCEKEIADYDIDEHRKKTGNACYDCQDSYLHFDDEDWNDWNGERAYEMEKNNDE
ncbi:MAG: hypothetical protein SFW66_09085 [Gammaproteobacteria bacterium]|nr:hypothetical protein [Gammaproteobacteria bacterium]